MGVALAGYSLPVVLHRPAALLLRDDPMAAGPDHRSTCPSGSTRRSGSPALILPWIALAILYAAFYSRITRSQMLETLGEDYIRTARSKGLPERAVIPSTPCAPG